MSKNKKVKKAMKKAMSGLLAAFPDKNEQDLVDNKVYENEKYKGLDFPVLHTVEADVAQTHYFAIRKDPAKPISSAVDCCFINCIQFYDLGSRRLMAINGCFGESYENSVDIFNKFILENQFTETGIGIKLGNLNGFLNLQCCIKEINKRYAQPDGFAFLEDYARAGTLKDNAHLDSSRRAFCIFELSVIEYYKKHNKVVGTFKRRRSNDSLFAQYEVTMIDISLEEFKESGLLEEYQSKHNNSNHRFAENGWQKTWIPNVKYDAHLKLHPVFNFTEEDALRNSVLGYTKQKAVVNKEGLITFEKLRYSVPQDADFSRTNPTPVYICNIGNGLLAVFSVVNEQFICYATVSKAATLMASKYEAIKAVVAVSGAYRAICKQFEKIALPINEKVLKDLVEQGLTNEIVATILANNPDVKTDGGSDKNGRRWLYFCMNAKDILWQLQLAKEKNPPVNGGLTTGCLEL